MSSPFVAPVALPSAQQWQLFDQLDRTAATPAAGSDGTATVALPQLDGATYWQLSHMVVSCTSTTPTAVRFYLDSPIPGYLRDGSDQGNFDVADWPMGLYVPPSRALVAQWTSATPGAVGTLTVQGLIYRMSGS